MSARAYIVIKTFEGKAHEVVRFFSLENNLRSGHYATRASS